jgi:Sushi repeat (SCR repeat)
MGLGVILCLDVVRAIYLDSTECIHFKFKKNYYLAEHEAGRYWWERVDQPPEGILVEDYCGFPPVPVHGQAYLNDSHTFFYKCEKGFQLNGNETTVCDPKTGQWSSLPTCNCQFHSS